MGLHVPLFARVCACVLQITSGRFISHRWFELRIDERPHSGNRFQTITFIFVIDPLVPRGIERPDGEWLGWMWRAATDIRLEWALVESSV